MTMELWNLPHIWTRAGVVGGQAGKGHASPAGVHRPHRCATVPESARSSRKHGASFPELGLLTVAKWRTFKGHLCHLRVTHHWFSDCFVLQGRGRRKPP